MSRNIELFTIAFIRADGTIEASRHLLPTRESAELQADLWRARTDVRIEVVRCVLHIEEALEPVRLCSPTKKEMLFSNELVLNHGS